MPPLPWTTISVVDADTETVVMASRLPLRSYRKVPGFLRRTLQIRRQLAHAPGLVGYALDAQILRKTFWTLSAWTSREALEQFAGADPHHTATASIRPGMLSTTFVFWTATAGDLPIPWAEVRRRVAERAEAGPSPRRHGATSPQRREVQSDSGQTGRDGARS